MKCLTTFVNKIIMRKYGVSIVIILLILFATNFCVKNIWEIINQYRTESIVLRHFKDDSNPLKYRAAHFILENMSYQHSYSDEDLRNFEDAYIIMAKNAKEFRDSVITEKTKNLLFLKKYYSIIKLDFIGGNK